LRRAVELAERVIASAHHGQHVAGGVVHGQQRRLRARVLFERRPARRALHCAAQLHVDHVTGFREHVSEALAGPLPVVRLDHNRMGAYARIDLQGQDAGDQGMNVVAGAAAGGPIGMAIAGQSVAIGQHIV
jgi:hypothetical protein